MSESRFTSNGDEAQITRPNVGLGIKQFYAGKTLLITGATGFVGKVVLEKIIRACPTFKKVFVMIRAKKNMSLG